MGIRNNKGFTLVEILVAVVCTFIVAIGFVSIQKNLNKGEASLRVINTIIEKKRVFDAVLSDRQAFMNTINRPENSNMACLRNGTNCDPRYIANGYTVAQDRIVVYDRNNNLFYDGRASNTKGFTEKGTACDGFQYTGAGNDECPIGFAVSWFIGNADTTKVNNVSFVAKMIYNPSDKNSQKRKINSLADSEMMNAYDSAQVFSMKERPTTNVISCLVGSTEIFNGGVYRFYETDTVNIGSQCASEARVCTVINGVPLLSGSYTNTSCTQNCYGTFSSCTATCGGGTRTFTRLVERNDWGLDCAYPTGYSEACNTQTCAAVTDCQGTWEPCSQACGGGQQNFTVTTPPANGGAACPSSPQSCNTQSCALPVDCQGTWGTCSAPCGGGQQGFIVSTSAANGGAACPASPRSCNTQSCSVPVNCDVTWGACSATCGGGLQNFTINTPAANGGTACPTAPRACNSQACNVDCEGSWGTCSRTCGGGVQNFNMTTAQSGNGASCPISPRSCNSEACPPTEPPPGPAPVDCQGSWGACSRTCGGGTKNFIATVQPANGGMACPAPETCNTQGCPVDCQGTWGLCSRTCGGGVETFNIGTQPANNGVACPISPRTCNTQGCNCPLGVNHGQTTRFYETATVPFGQTCRSQDRTCDNGDLSGSYTNTTCTVQDAPIPVCDVYYQFKNDSRSGVVAHNGTQSVFFSGADKDCNDSLCGFRVGIACASGAQVKLKYQFKYFSQDSIQQETPFSGLDGGVRWGDWAGLYVPGHVRDECQYPLFCGMRVEAETLNGRACTVSYQYHIEKSIFGNAASNGVWSLLTRSGGADENCDDSGGCGMQISINCGGGNIPVAPVAPREPPDDFR